MNFDEFREDASDMTNFDLAQNYRKRNGEAFFLIEETYPVISDAELREWLLWCMYYGKPKEEYPLAKQFDNR
jgi:hypothetical protein